MARPHTAAVTEALYDAAVDPGTWPSVMALLKRQYDTQAEAFYFLDHAAHGLRPVSINGIADGYYRSFSECFYTSDNPCIRSAALHTPGVVRTDQHLVEYFADPQILRRSTYYNEWMRPQDLAHTMGTTPLVEDDIVLNLSLLRPADRGGFSDAEVREFSRMTGHLQRALRLALQLDTLRRDTSLAGLALDQLRHGVAVVDAQGRLLHCNTAAESLLRQQRGLALRRDRLVATDPADQHRLGALLRHCAHHPVDPMPAGLAHFVTCTAPGQAGLIINAVPLRGAQTTFAAPRAAVLVSITDPAPAQPAEGIDAAAALFSLTAAELRLARPLAEGQSLKAAALQAAMSYETARWYLKILFQKTGTRRQAELVHKLLAGQTAPWSRNRPQA